MKEMNDNADKPKHGFFCKVIDEEGNISYVPYIPKKTRNKKDIVAAHRRSSKKTNRQLIRKEIKDEMD